MANETENLHDALEALICDEKNKELECRAYLKYARDLLVDVTTATFLEEAEEYRGHSGNSDYLIVCRAVDAAGIETNKAYLWEVKAPQCFLFEHDTNNRVRPTKEFISAENQLLHYYEESRGSTQFRDEFRITHPDDVKLGGLIIGSKRTWVRGGNYDASTLARLYKRALDLRRRYLYGNSGIKVMIWDHFLDYLKKQEAPKPSGKVFNTSISIPEPNYTIVNSGG
jgi:hypothetical protein